MTMSKCLMMTVVFVGAVSAGSACTSKAADGARQDAAAAADASRSGTDKALDATKKAGNEAADVTKDVAQKTADKTRDVAVAVADKSKEIASTTGTMVTDGWITTKVKAKFADETVLKGSDIEVHTANRVVTLKGTVPSRAARTRATAIAGGTEHVTRVVNQLVVK